MRVAVTVVAAVRLGREERADRLFIVYVDTHRQGGIKWRNSPGKKYTDVNVLKTNTGSVSRGRYQLRGIPTGNGS